MAAEALETDLFIADVPGNDLWDVSYFEDFRVRLVNGNGVAKIVDMVEWKKEHGL